MYNIISIYNILLSVHSIEFTKIHCLGNDFIIIKNDIKYQEASFIKRISDRRLGLGCDQLLLYSIENSVCSVDIYNSDTSVASACGNGTSALSYLFKENGIRYIKTKERKIAISNLDGKIFCNMGKAKAGDFITEKDLWKIAKDYNVSNIVCVDIGNLHVVVFHHNISYKDMHAIAKIINNFVQGGVNINFASRSPDSIRVKTFERGVGFTLACGTGACASFFAASSLGLISKKVDIELQHGKISLQENLDGDIIMHSIPTIVAKGKYYYE